MNNKKEVVYNRSVPFNTEAEVYVLGSIFIDNKIIDGLIGKLADTDFYEPRHVMIYRAMVNLRNNGNQIDVLSVVEELKRLNYNDVPNISNYLVEIIDSVPSIASVKLYIEIVEEKAIERKLLHKMQGLSDDILNHRYELNDMLDKVESNIMEVIKLRRTSEFMTLTEAAEEVFEKINSYVGKDQEIIGLDTGYPNLNKATLGFQKGDLMILAARPAVGKSSYAINLALQVAKNNDAHVAFFSLEMSIEQLMMRIYSYQAGVDLGKIRSGNLNNDELLLLSLAKEDLAKQNLYFDVSPSSNIADIRTKCRQLKNAGKLDFVVIDYLQLITVENSRGNRQEEVSKISRQLKTLAQELQVPILALSQLSRGVEDRENKTPQLADLRESGSIEQDADIVFFIYRRKDVEDQDVADQLNEKLKEEQLQRESKSKKEMLEVIISIAKNRQGPLQDFDYHFYGHLCRFTEQKEFRKPIGKRKKAQGMRRLNGNNNNN
ncbi:MAG: replicative DNA helicase [Erysipelotrichaceae bacterium]|nr:replicative DNA helicase [Erysipelotrichaceae bacterium]